MRQINDLQDKVEKTVVLRQKAERILLEKNAKLSATLSDLQICSDTLHALQSERLQIKTTVDRMQEAITEFQTSTGNNNSRQEAARTVSCF